MQDVHVRGELAECLVEIVHLGQNTHNHNDRKSVCAGMCELVLARKCELQSNTESLDRHDRERANRRTDRKVDQRVLASILGRDLINHEDGEAHDQYAVEHETCADCVR